jgi:hypothetical protein
LRRRRRRRIARYRLCRQGENMKGNCGAFAINKVKRWVCGNGMLGVMK